MDVRALPAELGSANGARGIRTHDRDIKNVVHVCIRIVPSLGVEPSLHPLEEGAPAAGDGMEWECPFGTKTKNDESGDEFA